MSKLPASSEAKDVGDRSVPEHTRDGGGGRGGGGRGGGGVVGFCRGGNNLDHKQQEEEHACFQDDVI